MNFIKHRARVVKEGVSASGPVIYWMSRDQRVCDNWALLFAQALAVNNNKGFAVIFTLQQNFLEAGFRQYAFMLKGLKEVAAGLNELNIPFFLLYGKPADVIPAFIKEYNAGVIVADFDPLRIKQHWKTETAKLINIPFYEVDAHNIVPCVYASGKEEFGAYTIRPKITRLLPEFLDEFTVPEKIKNNFITADNQFNLTDIYKTLKCNFSVKEVDWIKPGEEAAHTALADFLENRISAYNDERNNPVLNGQSGLSPYLHFGQISAQRVALEVKKRFTDLPSANAFLEELIIRRELADNFCYHNKNYDSFEGFKDWAKKTLNEHSKDEREHIYTLTEFENARTHEELWNAAQKELINKGKMHGYMRMYWAKKILEWSSCAEEALRTAIYLNDKYSLDGRDPNGYTGCAWSIGGVHDRAWAARPVFGKIRYMNYNGCKRKFDAALYIERNK